MWNLSIDVGNRAEKSFDQGGRVLEEGTVASKQAPKVCILRKIFVK